jgi:hypothetical protein
MTVRGQPHATAAFPLGITLVSILQEPGCGRFGEQKHFLLLLEFESPTFQPKLGVDGMIILKCTIEI